MQVCLIWAQARNRAIGRAGSMPWHVPEDLAHFRRLTMGCPVIMGRKTWESLSGKALPGRQNIVVTREQGRRFEGALSVNGLSQALESAQPDASGRVFVIGGGELYAQALGLAHVIHVTELDLDVEGADAFAPELPAVFELAGDVAADPARDSAYDSAGAPEGGVSRTGVGYRFRRYVRRGS